jgi:hypothetical protein
MDVATDGAREASRAATMGLERGPETRAADVTAPLQRSTFPAETTASDTEPGKIWPVRAHLGPRLAMLLDFMYIADLVW